MINLFNYRVPYRQHRLLPYWPQLCGVQTSLHKLFSWIVWFLGKKAKCLISICRKILSYLGKESPQASWDTQKVIKHKTYTLTLTEFSQVWGRGKISNFQQTSFYPRLWESCNKVKILALCFITFCAAQKAPEDSFFQGSYLYLSLTSSIVWNFKTVHPNIQSLRIFK